MAATRRRLNWLHQLNSWAFFNIYLLEIGFDGGLHQWFVLEVFDQQSGSLQANISAKYPVLSVTGLDAGRFFRMVIFAVNIRGRSEPVVLEGYTLKALEKQTGKIVNQFRDIFLKTKLNQ